MSANVLNPIRKNGHFYTCEEKDSGLSDEEQERKGPKKSSKAHENGDIQSGRTFCRNSKQFLNPITFIRFLNEKLEILKRWFTFTAKLIIREYIYREMERKGQGLYPL